MAKIGDKVRFLNDVGGGVIVRIDGKTVYVRDPEDGFETPMPLNEIIVVPGSETETYSDPEPVSDDVPLPPSKPVSHPYLTAALIFEPQDIRRLSQTVFDLYLVNDSNFKIYYIVASRDDNSSTWSTIEAGEAEPNVQVFLGEIQQDELNSLRHISVQIIAHKPSSDFELQAPVRFEYRLDITRLAKLHCFTPTCYSSAPVLTIPIITNGRTPEQLNTAPLSEKKEFRQEKKSQPTARAPHPMKKDDPEVVDLHIHELLDSTAGLQPADMLACQLREFERRMEAAAKYPGKKIIFIHGKGEGVLRAALLDRLRKRWPRCEAQDASFREYGFGATQITIHR